MNAMWEQLLPGLWQAFWLTIQLIVRSTMGASILATILTTMLVSPVAIFRSISTFYISVVRNTPLTLIVLFCSFGLYQNLGMALASRESSTFLADNNCR